MQTNPHSGNSRFVERTLDEQQAIERTRKLARNAHDETRFQRRETRRALRHTLTELSYLALDFSVDTSLAVTDLKLS